MEQGLQSMKCQKNLAVWAQRVQDCRASGLTVRQWCEENDIVPNTYFRWQRKVFSAICAEQEQFYEVPIQKTSGRSTVSVDVNGMTANIYCGADEATVLAVLRAMKSC